MIYIIAFGVGLKCPCKIHLNTQWGGADYASQIFFLPTSLTGRLAKRSLSSSLFFQESQAPYSYCYVMTQVGSTMGLGLCTVQRTIFFFAKLSISRLQVILCC